MAQRGKKTAAVKKASAKKASAKQANVKRANAKRPSVKKASAKAAPQSQERRLPSWIADHLERYLATNGADGHLWRGLPCLLLTTTGRRSNEERILPLIYGRDGDRYVIVASRGGAPDHPAWYKNLVENPEVTVQVKADRFSARARTANRDERPRLWRAMNRLFPFYDQYQSRTRREIPVILIERH